MSERVVLPLLLALICLLSNCFQSEAFASSKLFLTESRTRSKIIEKSFIREDCVTVLNLGAGNDAQSSNSDDEEEEEDPLALGIDAVRWLPSVKEKQVKESSNSNNEVCLRKIEAVTYLLYMCYTAHFIFLYFLSRTSKYSLYFLWACTLPRATKY